MTSIYGNVLVHLDGAEHCAERIAIGIEIAKATKARLTGFFAESDPEVPGPIATWPTPRFVARRDAAEKAFTEAVAAAGIEGVFHALGSGRPSVIMHEMARAARAADLTIVSQRDPDRDAHLPDFFVGHAVADSGAAVLVLPYAGKFQLGQGRAVIAWDGEKATSRAMRAAMPLIGAAAEVVVFMIPLTGAEPEADPPAYADPVAWLDGLHHKVEREHLSAKAAHISDVIISRVADDVGGLLVVGINNPDAMRNPLRKTKARRLLDQITIPTVFAT